MEMGVEKKRQSDHKNRKRIWTCLASPYPTLRGRTFQQYEIKRMKNEGSLVTGSIWFNGNDVYQVEIAMENNYILSPEGRQALIPISRSRLMLVAARFPILKYKFSELGLLVNENC